MTLVVFFHYKQLHLLVFNAKQFFGCKLWGNKISIAIELDAVCPKDSFVQLSHDKSAALCL